MPKAFGILPRSRAFAQGAMEVLGSLLNRERVGGVQIVEQPTGVDDQALHRRSRLLSRRLHSRRVAVSVLVLGV